MENLIFPNLCLATLILMVWVGVRQKGTFPSALKVGAAGEISMTASIFLGSLPLSNGKNYIGSPIEIYVAQYEALFHLVFIALDLN